MTTLAQTTVRAAATTAPQRVRRQLSGRVASAVAIVIAILWTTPTFGLLLSSLRPEDQIKTTGWWTFFSAPQLTLENYREVLFGTSSSSGQMMSFLINSVVITIPSVLFPLAAGGLRRLRAGLAAVPRTRVDLHRHLRAPDRAAPDVARPAAVLLLPGRGDLRCPAVARLGPGGPGPLHPGLVRAYLLRPAAGHLPAAQLHVRASRRAHGGGQGRRRQPRSDPAQARPSPGPSRAGDLRDLPVPLGLERPAGGA